MRTITIDCSGTRSPDEFWQRYVDAANPAASELFGRNLDAFWDAIQGGGPGCPGDVKLVFTHSDSLASFLTNGGGSFLTELREIAASATRIEVKLT